jgi:hypothetical protein
MSERNLMNSKFCLLLLFGAPSSVFAQEPPKPGWALGVEAGYTGMYAYVDNFAIGQTVANPATSSPSIPHDKGGEGVLAIHLGKPMNPFLRTDAYLSLNLVGVGFGNSSLAFGPVSGGTYSNVSYDGADSDGFLSTGLRLVAERWKSRSAVRPRGSVTATWQWTKGPAAAFSGGVSAGNANTRFTIDAGEQFAWLGFRRVIRTYRASDNALLDEQHINGSKRINGFSVRLGVDHYVF